MRRAGGSSSSSSSSSAAAATTGGRRGPSDTAAVAGAIEKKQQEQQAMECFRQGFELIRSGKQLDRGVEYLDAAIALRPRVARYYYVRGNAFRALGRYQRAFFDYTSAIRLEGSDPFYFCARGICHRKLRRMREAVQDLTVAIDMTPTEPSFLFNRGLVYYEMGDFSSAEADFTRSIVDGHRHAYRALFNRANCYRKMGALDRAVRDLQHAVELDPSAPAAHNSLGLALCERGAYTDALDSISRALDASPNNPLYLNNRGLVLYHLGRLREALSDLQAAIQLMGSADADPSAWFHRGNVHLAAGRLRDALEDLDTAVRLTLERRRSQRRGALGGGVTGTSTSVTAASPAPATGSAAGGGGGGAGGAASGRAMASGSVSSRTGPHDGTGRVAGGSRSGGDDDGLLLVPPLRTMGSAMEDDDEEELARQAARRPRHGGGGGGGGVSTGGDGADWEEDGDGDGDGDGSAGGVGPLLTTARSTVTTGAGVFPRTVLSEAEVEALVLTRDDDVILLAREQHSVGLAFQALGEFGIAREHFAVALALWPEHTPSKYHLALMFHALGDHGRAEEELGGVLLTADGAKDRRVLEARGLARQALGRQDEAIVDFDAALAQDPSRGELHYHRAVSLLRMRPPRLRDAIRSLRAAVEHGFRTGEVWDKVATAQLLRGRVPAAILAYSEALKLDETNRHYRCRRAQCFRELGDAVAAEHDLTVALEAGHAADLGGPDGVSHHVPSHRPHPGSGSEAFAGILAGSSEVGPARGSISSGGGSGGGSGIGGGTTRGMSVGRAGSGAAGTGSGGVDGAADADPLAGVGSALAGITLAPNDPLMHLFGRPRVMNPKTGRAVGDDAAHEFGGDDEAERGSSGSRSGAFGRGVSSSSSSSSSSFSLEERARILHLRGLARYDQDRFEDAINDFHAALDAAPRPSVIATLWFTLGIAYANTDRHGEAVGCFSRALAAEAAHPGCTPVLEVLQMWHERAKSLQMLGRHEEAVRDFTEVIARNPTNAHAHFRRGFSFKALRRYSEAADDFEAAKHLDPENPHLAVNYRTVHLVESVVLCAAGEEPIFPPRPGEDDLERAASLLGHASGGHGGAGHTGVGYGGVESLRGHDAASSGASTARSSVVGVASGAPPSLQTVLEHAGLHGVGGPLAGTRSGAPTFGWRGRGERPPTLAGRDDLESSDPFDLRGDDDSVAGGRGTSRRPPSAGGASVSFAVSGREEAKASSGLPPRRPVSGERRDPPPSAVGKYGLPMPAGISLESRAGLRGAEPSRR